MALASGDGSRSIHNIGWPMEGIPIYHHISHHMFWVTTFSIFNMFVWIGLKLHFEWSTKWSFWMTAVVCLEKGLRTTIWAAIMGHKQKVNHRFRFLVSENSAIFPCPVCCFQPVWYFLQHPPGAPKTTKNTGFYPKKHIYFLALLPGPEINMFPIFWQLWAAQCPGSRPLNERLWQAQCAPELLPKHYVWQLCRQPILFGTKVITSTSLGTRLEAAIIQWFSFLSFPLL